MPACFNGEEVHISYFAVSGNSVRVTCLVWRWFVTSAMTWLFACVFFRELHFFFLSSRTEGPSSCVGPTRSYRSCNVQVWCSGFSFSFLLLLFPRQTSFLFRNVIISSCFSDVTSGCSSLTVFIQKYVEIMPQFEGAFLLYTLFSSFFIILQYKHFLFQTELPGRFPGFPGRAVCRVWWDRIPRQEI